MKFREIFENILNEGAVKRDYFLKQIDSTNKNGFFEENVVLDINASSISDNFMGIVKSVYFEKNKITYKSYPLYGNPEAFSTLQRALNRLKEYLNHFENDPYEELFKNFNWRKFIKFSDEITKSQQTNFLK